MKATHSAIAVGLAIMLALALAQAGEPSLVLREQLYGPPRYVAFIADLQAPSIIVPIEFAVQAVPIITCESHWNTEAVGKEGERGLLQIHPIHRPRMASLGLDFDQERDRMLFAVVLWRESGGSFRPHWSCAR